LAAGQRRRRAYRCDVAADRSATAPPNRRSAG